jgi:outer membrane protein W
MRIKKLLILMTSLFMAQQSFAGVYEVGGSFSWNRSNYNAGSYTWSRSYGLSLGYYFTQDSEVQFSYQDTTNKTFVEGVQDTTYRDRVYSINLVYHFMEEQSSFRPFVRLGVGQLNRDATGTYSAAGYYAPGRLDTVSVIGGLGFKLKLTDKIAIKTEATSYLTGGSIGSWQDNLTFNFGGAFYF